MTRYVHPDVAEVKNTEGPSVTLIVVPEEGERDRVAEAIRGQSGTIEGEVLDMFKATVPRAAIEPLTEMEFIRSIAPEDVAMEDLREGNRPTLQT